MSVASFKEILVNKLSTSRTGILLLSAFWITKCSLLDNQMFCVSKLCKAFNSSLNKLLFILLLLKLSKQENAVSKIVDLTALVREIDKSVLLIS